MYFFPCNPKGKPISRLPFSLSYTILLVNYINNLQDVLKLRIGDNNTGSGTGSMNDLAVAQIDRHMTDTIYTITSVEQQIAGLCILITDLSSFSGLCLRGMTQLNPELCHYFHRKAGTVDSFGQTGAAKHIRIPLTISVHIQ